MSIFDRTFESEQLVRAPLEEVFSFFCKAENLERITPPSLRFRILTPLPIEMRAGALIDYQLSLHGLPMRWRTEILEWDPPHRFVDVQLRGPYSLWHHTHRFEAASPTTTRMLDTVRFRAPFGPLGFLAVPIFVAPEVARIFAHRRKVIEEIFR